MRGKKMWYEEDYKKFQITEDMRKNFEMFSDGYELNSEKTIVSIKTINLSPEKKEKIDKEANNA
jgi:hypothetical protein